DDRLSEPYGVREAGRICLTACHPNRVQARSAARLSWPRPDKACYAVSEHFTSKFAQRERAAIPELALSCLCRRKHSRFLGLAKKCASGSTRADDANTGWWRRCPELARTGLRPCFRT